MTIYQFKGRAFFTREYLYLYLGDGMTINLTTMSIIEFNPKDEAERHPEVWEKI